MKKSISVIALTSSLLLLTACSQNNLPVGLVQPVAPTQAQIIHPAEPKEFTLVVKDNKLASGPETLQVTQGAMVMIHITSDAAEKLHLHGYDMSVELGKNAPATLTLIAGQSGRFTYELENSKTEIGALEVQPS